MWYTVLVCTGPVWIHGDFTKFHGDFTEVNSVLVLHFQRDRYCPVAISNTVVLYTFSTIYMVYSISVHRSGMDSRGFHEISRRFH